MNIEIQPYNASHAHACAELEAISFSEPWSERELCRLPENPAAVYFTALADGKVIGYGGLYRVLDEGSINNIAVLPDFRRLGVARKLLNALFLFAVREGLSRITLEVRTSNTPAIALYESEGFRKAGLRRGLYSHPREDGLIMEKLF